MNGSHEFEQLYAGCRRTVEHYVYCKISNRSDAEDVLQTALLSGFRNFHSLKENGSFKRWMLSIASNKIKDYYGQKSRELAIPLDFIEHTVSGSCYEPDIRIDVQNAMSALRDKEQEILYLYYIKGFAQRDIAARLSLPLGTVKSRLSSAKKHFAEKYDNTRNEASNMNTEKFPKIMPEYTIQKKDAPVFNVVCEEVPGWLITPRLGEKQSFAFYDKPDGHISGLYSMKCVRSAVIHGIDCVQISVTQREEDGSVDKNELFVRLTDTHCMYVASMKTTETVITFGSFMDEEWLSGYGVGDENCGRETHQSQKGFAVTNKDGSITANTEITEKELSDLIGRYDVKINGKTFDTVAMLSLFNNDHMVIQHLDKNGRTVLFRRFNRRDWKHDRYGFYWDEKLPESETVILNESKFIHWYDCIPESTL